MWFWNLLLLKKVRLLVMFQIVWFVDKKAIPPDLLNICKVRWGYVVRICLEMATIFGTVCWIWSLNYLRGWSEFRTLPKKSVFSYVSDMYPQFTIKVKDKEKGHRKRGQKSQRCASQCVSKPKRAWNLSSWAWNTLGNNLHRGPPQCVDRPIYANIIGKIY